MGFLKGLIVNILTGFAEFFWGKHQAEKRAEAESRSATLEGQWKSDIESRDVENGIKNAQDDAKKKEENKPDNPDDVLNSENWNNGGGE